MRTSPFSPYHLGEQEAIALLTPIAATLAELEARLNQYVTRIPMADADRETVARVEAIVRDAQSRVAEIVSST